MSAPKSFSEFRLKMEELLCEARSLATAHGLMLENDILEAEASPILQLLLGRLNAAQELLAGQKLTAAGE